jgi:hypothetical protein
MLKHMQEHVGTYAGQVGEHQCDDGQWCAVAAQTPISVVFVFTARTLLSNLAIPVSFFADIAAILHVIQHSTFASHHSEIHYIGSLIKMLLAPSLASQGSP